jgi:hypothetical protein
MAQLLAIFTTYINKQQFLRKNNQSMSGNSPIFWRKAVRIANILAKVQKM